MNRLLNDVLDTSTVTICQPLAKFSGRSKAGEVREVIARKQCLLVEKKLARPERLELPTLWFEARCSIQLSYGRAKPL
jgi:hypothetical protein